MENQSKRKLAAFLAAVMFTTSLPVPVVAEDSAETISAATVETIPETTAATTSTQPTKPETVPTTVPETEPVTEPVTEPATEPVTEPVTEPATEPATEPEVQPEKNPIEGSVVAKGPVRSLMMAGRMAEPTAQNDLTLTEGPSFTIEQNNTTGMVFLTVSMEGATHFRLLYGEAVQGEYESNNGTLTLGLRFTEATTVCFSACVDGVWTANGPAQEIAAMEKPALGSVALVIPATVRAGEDIELTWSTVEYAQNYNVTVSQLVNSNHAVQVWSDYLDAATEACRTVIPAGKLKQGSYYVSVRATASGYYDGMSNSVVMEVGAPLLGNEFECTISSDGTEAYLYSYLGDPNVEEVVIPETIQGATVVGIYGGNFLKNNGTLKKVTIPASVGYISDDAFTGSTDLTIYGYSGSDAEEFAVFNGYTFEPLDSGESTVSATWTEPILVNAETTLLVSAPGTDYVELRVDGSVDYKCQTHLTESGATIIWTPEESGSQIIQIRARIEGEYISSRYYTVSVTSVSTMPQVENLVSSASPVEPGTAVAISWNAPEGVTAPEYSVGILPASEDYTYWYDVAAGKSTYTFGASWFDDEGNYTLFVRLKGTAGMESSVTACTVEVKSTQLWDYNSSSKTLIAYNGTDTEITIPSEINGQPVWYLGSSLFSDSDITSVTIPEGVKSIGWQCFYNCNKLTTVNLPATLTGISNTAFSGCTELSQIQLPAGLTTLASYAFSGCDALTSVVIPEGITELEQGVFSSCDSLSQVTLPENLASIEAGAFSYCKQLKTITIPQSVNSISEYAFQYVEGLTIQGYSGSAAEVFAETQGYTFVALGAAETGDISFVLKSDKVYQSGYLKITVTAPDAEKLRLYLDNNVTEYSISNGKAELSLFAIYSLGEHSVTVSQCIDDKWLAPCEVQTFAVIEMPKPVIEPIDPTSAGTPVLVLWKPVEGAQSYTLYVSKDTVHIADFQNVQNLDKDGYLYQQLEGELLTLAGYYDLQVTAHMAEGGNSYGQLSFEVTEAEEFFYEVNSDGTATLTGCNSTAQTVTVPDQLDGHAVVTIAEKAFLNTPAVTIVLPASVQLVEQWAFYGCEDLETVKILDAQANIRQFAFENCTKLVGIYLGKGIFVDDHAFDSCRTDTVIYGYSGGQVEEVANSVRTFSSLGELAAGPVVTAENIWQHEKVNYSVSYENAAKLYVQEVYPDGNVESSTYAAAQLEKAADSYSFAELTEDSQMTIKAAALVNGAWTAYTEKKVTISVLKELTAPVFEEIGALERHVDQTITWYPVEDAQQYRVIISSGMHVVDHDETVENPEITLKAGSLQEGNYTIRVTAMAEGCEDATGSAEFEMISLKLDQPVITVDKRIARHLGAKITWEPVSVAENYTVVVQTEGINGPLTLYRNVKLEETEVILTPEQLKVGNCTVSVTANALYCTSSDTATAEFEIYEEQLNAPEITAPEAVVGGVEFDITWKSVENAEWYHLEIVNGDDYRVFHKTVDSSTLSQTVLLDAYLPEEILTLRVIASANYRVDGVAELHLSYKPLYTYEVVDGNAVITGYNGSDAELSVPGWINGYRVIAIGDSAFEGDSSITTVFLDENVEIIGDRSFKNCTALQRITGMGVREIGEEAFYNCTSLTHISFGKYESGVKTKPNAFYNTPITDPDQETVVDGLLNIIITDPSDVKDHSNNLLVETVTYEEGITEIPARTHYNNTLLRKVVLPKSLKTIGSEAFAECSTLRAVWLYDGVEEIAEDAFSNSDNLCLYIRTSDMARVSYVEQYAIDHNIPFEKSYISPMTSAIYPEGTYGVAERDHFGNEFLQHVHLPESLQFIQSKAFAQCENLLGVYMYDGITSIADDAFEGSNSVRFVIYVTDLETVSYVERYAKDHDIPYTKLQKDGSASDAITLGEDTGPITVKIDTPVQITVIDIPTDADHLNVYHDGELIYSEAIDQVVSIGFTYTFRQFGQQSLTAEALRDDEVIKHSEEKAVIVTGIRLTADKDTAWTCEPVNFTVEAYPVTGELYFYAEELQFATVYLEDTAGTLTYAFTKAGDRQITVRSDSGLVSETLILPILCIGQLDKPVLEAEELQFVDDGLVCSWNTTENTDGYVLHVRYANGQDILQRKITDDGSDRMTCTISAEELGGEGIYQLYLMNYGYKYDQNESETITVELTADKTPRFTMDKQSVETGDPVVFTFRAFDATSVELWCDGEVIETVPLTNGRGTLTRAFTQSGDRKMQICALQDGAWTELSDVQILKVTSKGALATVQVTAEPIQLLGNSIEASWTAVENADGYIVYFRNAAHETIYKLDTKECAVSVPADQVKQTGDYYFMVVAYGKGYDQSEGSANVAVLDHLPGPVIVTPAENEVCTNTAVKLTWQAVTGAESYVVSLSRKTGVDAAGQPVYEKVWAAPNETVNVGTNLSYDLTGLVYGGEYRVAVGTVSTLESGVQCIGWAERLFSVQMPELSVTLAANTLIPNEGGQVILTAVANHPMTQAVLTDETGAVVTTVSSGSEEVSGTRVFTFVVTEELQGQKTYTVTVFGIDALEEVKSVSASLDVKWIDPDAAAIESVTVVQNSVVVGKMVAFSITANAKTSRVEVYRQKTDANVDAEPIATLKPISSEEGKTTFYYLTKFDEMGEVTLEFVPCNDKNEKGEVFTKFVIVLPEGMLPAPKITNLAPNAVISNWGYTVKWDPVVLDPGETFGGYSVTVYTVGSSGKWEAMPNQYNVFVGTTCSYAIPAMDAGKWYRIEVYTVPAGMNQPVLNISGCSFVEFQMEGPDVSIEKPVNNATVLVGQSIPVEGTAAGGVTKVRVQLVTNNKPIPVKDANGNAVDYLVVDVVDGKFTADLDPVNDLTPSAGDATDHAVEVYGFLDGYPTEIDNKADSDWRMLDVDGAEIKTIQSNKVAPNNWVFVDENVHIEVSANKLVNDIALSDSVNVWNSTIHKDEKTSVEENYFWADFKASGEGLHVITAAPVGVKAESKSVNVYVVTPKPETEVHCKPDTTATGWIIPKEYPEGDTVTITEKTKLIQRGVCGEFVLVRVNDGDSFFVHEKYLDTPFIITFPDDGFELDLSENQLVELRWTTHPDATTYKMSIDVEIINEQGKREIVTFEKPDIAAQSGEYQWTTFNTFEIYAMVRRRCNFYTSSNWPITIRIGAYA